MSMTLPTCEQVDLRVGLDVRRAQLFRTGFIATGRVANHRGVVADDDDRLMPQFLKLPHLSQRHRVPQMHVGRGRVDTVLDAQRRTGLPALLAASAQFLFGNDLLNATLNNGELVFDGEKRHGLWLAGRTIG